jgi:hypothetical protein
MPDIKHIIFYTLLLGQKQKERSTTAERVVMVTAIL